jgi:hypothetical protein
MSFVKALSPIKRGWRIASKSLMLDPGGRRSIPDGGKFAAGRAVEARRWLVFRHTKKTSGRVET